MDTFLQCYHILTFGASSFIFKNYQHTLIHTFLWDYSSIQILIHSRHTEKKTNLNIATIIRLYNTKNDFFNGSQTENKHIFFLPQTSSFSLKSFFLQQVRDFTTVMVFTAVKNQDYDIPTGISLANLSLLCLVPKKLQCNLLFLPVSYNERLNASMLVQGSPVAV